MKTYLVLAAFGLLVVSMGMVAAGDSQLIKVDVSDSISFDVTPPTLDFVSITYGTSVTLPGPSVVLSTVGSNTETGNVFVSAEITGDSNLALGGFFNTLLQFNTGTETPVWTTTSLLDITIPAGSSLILPIRLYGNTAQFGAGEKTATITYSATGVHP